MDRTLVDDVPDAVRQLREELEPVRTPATSLEPAPAPAPHPDAPPADHAQFYYGDDPLDDPLAVDGAGPVDIAEDEPEATVAYDDADQPAVPTASEHPSAPGIAAATPAAAAPVLAPEPLNLFTPSIPRRRDAEIPSAAKASKRQSPEVGGGNAADRASSITRLRTLVAGLRGQARQPRPPKRRALAGAAALAALVVVSLSGHVHPAPSERRVSPPAAAAPPARAKPPAQTVPASRRVNPSSAANRRHADRRRHARRTVVHTRVVVRTVPAARPSTGSPPAAVQRVTARLNRQANTPTGPSEFRP